MDVPQGRDVLTDELVGGYHGGVGTLAGILVEADSNEVKHRGRPLVRVGESGWGLIVFGRVSGCENVVDVLVRLLLKKVGVFIDDEKEYVDIEKTTPAYQHFNFSQLFTSPSAES